MMVIGSRREEGGKTLVLWIELMCSISDWDYITVKRNGDISPSLKVAFTTLSCLDASCGRQVR